MQIEQGRNYILSYLKSKLESKFNKNGRNIFTCPSCLNRKASATFIVNSSRMICHNCNFEGKLVDIFRELEKDKDDWENTKIMEYLYKQYNIKLPYIDTKFYLETYKCYGFDLVPLIRNKKIPFEINWLNKEHKDLDEWKYWIRQKFNLGIKTGKKSNITVIDIDTHIIPSVFKKADTLVQKTNRGRHYVFQYDKDLPTCRISTLKIDILNDNKQFVVYPSRIDNVERRWNFRLDKQKDISKIPKEIKDYLKKYLKNAESYEDQDNTIAQEIKNENITNVELIGQGNRNNSMVKLGGMLRKQLSTEDTSYVLKLLNKYVVQPSLPYKELNAIIGSLSKYDSSDDRVLAIKILNYLDLLQDASSRDIQYALKEEKINIDKALNYLVKEQLIIRKGRYFKKIKKVLWRDDFPKLDYSIKFKVPYFDDVAHFNMQDLILLGGKSKVGKTHLALNIIKRLVDQGIKPYYLTTESGSRYLKVAMGLGMKESDFNWSVQVDPMSIELEPNAITVLDWLHIEDKAQTDSVIKYFIDQLIRTNGFLFLFQQLKEDDTWFAPNLIKQYPAFAARYIYDSEDGKSGNWKVDAIRDPKGQIKNVSIPCKYLWDEKKLVRVDEIEGHDDLLEEDEL